METLDFLWQLQKHDNNISYIKNKLKDIASGEKAQLMTNKLIETENKLIKLESRLEKNEEKLNKNNSILKQLDFQLKDIEKDLYGGDVVDLKQLSYLDKERMVLKKQIDKKEVEIISQMEDVEELKAEFIKIEEDFKNLRIEYTQLIKNCKIMVEKLKEKAKEEKEKMDILSSKIDSEALRVYVHLRNNKGNAVVEVVDNKCSGCNMLLPTFIADRLKNHNVIIHCENCDRILYLSKPE